MNSWNDGEKRAHERARGKQLDRGASTAETDATMRQIEREEEKEMEGDLARGGGRNGEKEREHKTARTRARSAGARSERDGERRPR